MPTELREIVRAFRALPESERARARAEVRVLILVGLGLNCEAETEAAFRMVGARTERVHLLDLLDRRHPRRLRDYAILAFVGGFSFGDHLGAGFVFANKIRWRLYGDLLEFIGRGGLVLGICNGFQTMTRLGLLPGFEGEAARATLGPNDRLGYRDAWVRVGFDPDSPCLWTAGLDTLDLPARHAEGKFLTAGPQVDERLRAGRQIVARYLDPEGRPTERWPFNPSGSPGGVAGVCDPTGRLLGLMPHPDAYIYPFQHPLWARWKAERREPTEGGGLAIFRNGVDAAASLACAG
jgi:phosphoribosylformylglycinamidine synthase